VADPIIALLPFLEERSYLHGTTLYRLLRPYVPSGLTRTCFRIARIISSNAIEVTCGDGTPKDADARLDWEGGVAGVRQLPLREPIARERYDESCIVTCAQITGNSASYRGISPYDAVATAVPLFKRLLVERGLTAAGGQWMFTRLDTARSEVPFRIITVRLEQHLSARIAKSVIELDGQTFADFYFSWVPDKVTCNRE
jgi:hypothetical protein